MIKKSIQSIVILLKYAKTAIFFKIALILLNALLTPLSMLFTQQLVDLLMAYQGDEGDLRGILIYIALLSFTFFFTAGNGFFDRLALLHIKKQLSLNLKPAVLRKFQRIKFSQFEDKSTHDSIHRMGTEPQDRLIEVFISTTNIIMHFLTMVGAAVVFSQISIWFSIGFLGFLLPMVWSDNHAMAMMNENYNKESTNERRLNYMINLLCEKKSLSEIKLYNAVHFFTDKIKELLDKIQKSRTKVTISSQKYMIFSSTLFKLWIAFVIFTLIYSVRQGSITLGIFVALVTAMGTIIDNTDQLSFNVSNLSRTQMELDHYNRFMSLPEVTPKTGVADVSGNATIQFENVSFRYPTSDHYVLRSLSFTISCGEKVAIVGMNGAGKSTIIKLLCKLYLPTQGRICLNGIDINQIDDAQYYATLGIVFQDYTNYQLSLRENIAFGRIEKLHEDEELIAALKSVDGEKILSIVPNGLDTHLGKIFQDGIDLSSGQWQRLAIARSCLPDASFVVLDEPTAALDPVAESNMYTLFLNVLTNTSKGCIIISHRMASAKMAKRILVIHNHTLSESGTHDQLMNMKGIYYEMYTSQREWYVEKKESGIEL